MDNKRLGLLILGIGLIFAVIILAFSKEPHNEDFCAASVDPARLISHIAIGAVFSTISLGLYLLFFSKSEKEIMRLISKQKNKELIDNKFEILLKGLNPDEKKVMSAIKGQDGISQHTLRLRTDIHKSKLSLVVSALEQKELIKKERKGKINYLFMRIEL
tara:strand:+ start:183 stop:662 length:480 start_codon:yes stop_codon:yes gene_type:complete